MHRPLARPGGRIRRLDLVDYCECFILCSIGLRAGRLHERCLLHIGLRTARQALHELAEMPKEVTPQQPTGPDRLAKSLIELRRII